MSFFQNTFTSQTTNESPVSNPLRLVSMRRALHSVKKVIETIKDIPLIRRLRSKYVPYGEWKSMYMDDELSNMASSDGGDSTEATVLYDYEFVGIRRKRSRRSLLQLDTLVESMDTLFSVYQQAENANVPERRSSDSGILKFNSPGSTIETKSKGTSAEYKVRLGENEPSSDPEALSHIDFTAQEPAQILVESEEISRSELLAWGSSARNQKPRQSRLLKTRIRGMFRRKYQQVKRAIARQRL